MDNAIAIRSKLQSIYKYIRLGKKTHCECNTINIRKSNEYQYVCVRTLSGRRQSRSAWLGVAQEHLLVQAA